ncbi:MAG: tRNA-guanine transglycosylase DpdA [Fimbriimonadaceae bacterium]
MLGRQLLVLGCSDRKRGVSDLLPAIDRYDGPYYRVLRNYLREHDWPRNLSVAVLSAEYGLVGGLTRIKDYNKRMTRSLALGKAEDCCKTLSAWACNHDSVILSLGNDYMPALEKVTEGALRSKTSVFEGGIGEKQSQVKSLLHASGASERRVAVHPKAGSGKVSYFLPDWDDLLDANFDFRTDRFSGASRTERNDKHCSILMKPERMCDGILVSLAQHLSGKGPLRRFVGSDESSLAPIDLRSRFGLADDQSLFGDCGAFSYANEEEPTISIEQAVALYDLHGFDFGASVDHIPVPYVTTESGKRLLTEAERSERVQLTKDNAAAFITTAKRRKAGFLPVGTIQALTPEGFISNVRLYHEMGYRHLAIGGLVPLADTAVEAIVTAVMSEASQLSPRPWVHLFGVFRPKLQAKFRELKVDSFDSATYFRKAWLRSDQNYLAPDGSWYAAIRVPMTSDPRTLKRLQEDGADVRLLQAQEAEVMRLLCRYDRDEADLEETLNAVLSYDAQLTRSSDSRSLKEKYQATLQKRPWRDCRCPFCREQGIHVLIFRGCNRNKRRGAHNTLMLYGSLGQQI